MNNGTLTTRDGSNTLKVTEVINEAPTHYGVNYWSVLIAGSSRSRLFFQKEYWDFTPEVLSQREQVEVLPVGARYRTLAGLYIWTKISDTLVAFYEPENIQNSGVVKLQNLRAYNEPIEVLS